MNNEPAFPRGPFHYGADGRILFNRKDQTDPGMSLRDWFAGLAMQGQGFMSPGGPSPELVADWAYQQADAMMRARQIHP